jgi:glycosyltransferase involved in cell wall biosynthesis
MRVAQVFPGLPKRWGGAILAGVAQARAVTRRDELHVVVLGEPDMRLVAELRRQVTAEIHSVPGPPGGVDQRLGKLLQDIAVEVVQVESLAGATWLSDPGSLGPRTLYRAYDVTFSVVAQGIQSATNQPVSRFGRALERVRLRRPLLILANERLRRHEIAVARRFDRVLCFSAGDRDVFRDYGIAANVVPLPMEASPEPHRPANDSTFRMAFIGSFTYFPNVDALAYLLQKIVPLLPASLLWRLDVVGADPPPFARMLPPDGPVHVRGYVDDLEDLLTRVDTVIVPLRIGGGVKLKTMTALARGIPVVTSSEGSTGISLRDGTEALVRDTAEGFADAISMLAADPSLRERIGEGGRRLIATAHAPLAVADALHAEYAAVSKQR